MTTTSIVREAVLAASGPAWERGDRALHLRERIAAVGDLPREQACECLEVLAPSCGERADPLVLEAALVLALVHPEAAAELGLLATELGRAFAARLEEDRDRAGARGVLEVLSEWHPGDVAVERALSALARRERRTQSAVERHVRRARALAARGRTEEAVRELRAVVALDPSRKDAARAIRDLRFEVVATSRRRRRRLRLALVSAAVSAAFAAVLVREVRTAAAYDALPPLVEGDLPSTRARLAALDDFVGAHLLWHGVLGAVRERAALRVESERLQEQERRQRERVLAAAARRLERADAARENARRLAGVGDYEAALSALERALALGGPDWPPRTRLLRDVEAIRVHLARAGGEVE